MYTVHEGEIVFKEKYGAAGRNRLYVKPPDQGNIVTIEENDVHDLTSLFTKLFLPQGYPDSVSKDYLVYQMWDTAQAFCSTITGTLATQEVLKGVGVGDTNATPLAATVTWVIKDGCGHLGRILFAYSHGSVLDAYSKKWRLYADTLNDAAMCMEIALPVFKHFTTPALCISTVMKAVVGVAGSATRAAMTQHHALRGNMADVSAKDAAQETAVNLIGSIFALMIIYMFGNSLIIFAVTIILHIFFNYMAVRSVCLRTLNEPRFLQVIDAYLKEEIISTPCEINRNEPIVFYQMGANLLDLKLCGFRIKIGQSLKKIITKHKQRPFYVKNIQEVYLNNNYVVFPDLYSRKMYVIPKEKAVTADILCAYFHAVLLAISICAINDYPLAIYKTFSNESRPFAQVCRTLHNAEWSRDDSDDPTAEFKQMPSIELMVYLDKIVTKEWPRIRKGLTHIGWDLSKHLLLIDEWRVCSTNMITKSISIDDLSASESTQTMSSRRILTFDGTGLKCAKDNILSETFTIEPDATAQSEKPTSSP